MTRCFSLLPSVCAALLLITGAPAPADATPAAPTSVVLYPAGGRIQVQAEVMARQGQISFELPAGTSLDTLVLGVDGGAVVSMESSSAPSLPEGQTVEGIREALRKARQEGTALDGEMASVKARIALWSKPPVYPTQVEEIEKLSTAIPERLKGLYAELASVEPRKEASARNIATLERQLIEAGGDRERAIPLKAGSGGQVLAPQQPKEGARRVSALIRLDGGNATPEGPVHIRYSYTLADCGWTPVYQLDALPDKSRVRFSQEAEIRQASGQNWDNVPLTLASADLGSGLEPAPLTAWSVRPMPEIVARSADMMPRQMNVASRPEGMMLMGAAAPMQDMSPKESPVATVWELGKQTIPAGRPVRVAMLSEDWRADFVRVARPARQKAVYLMADVTLPEPMDLPSGNAQFQVDGIAVGGGLFAMSGSSEKIYFGTDARVSAEMKLDTRKSGSKGFVDKRQTRSWAWTIEVKNHHASSVLVRVEDPEAQSRDQAIEITTTASPKPLIEDHVNTWTLNVPAKGKNEITYAVNVSAPSNMRLIDGR